MKLSTSAIVARNTEWTGLSHTEPYEAGWADEAIVFVRALKAPGGATRGGAGQGHVEISADGMTWLREGTSFELPQDKDATTFAKVSHFGTWLRIAADIPDGGAQTLLVTLHLKG